MNESVKKDIEFFDNKGILPTDEKDIDHYLKNAEKKMEILGQFEEQPEKFLKSYLISDDVEISDWGLYKGPFYEKFDTEMFPTVIVKDRDFERVKTVRKKGILEVDKNNFLLEIHPDLYVHVSSNNYFKERGGGNRVEEEITDQLLANALCIKAQSSGINSRIERLFLRDGEKRHKDVFYKNSYHIRKIDTDYFFYEYVKEATIKHLPHAIGTCIGTCLITGEPKLAPLFVFPIYPLVVAIDTLNKVSSLEKFYMKCKKTQPFEDKKEMNPFYLLLRGNIKEYFNPRKSFKWYLGKITPGEYFSISGSDFSRLGVKGEVMKYRLGM